MNLLNRARYPRRQAGQALVEFLAMAAPLLGLFLLMPMIGKYQDIAHATQMASRYAAFDATVHNEAAGSYKPPTQLAAEVRRRYFSRPDAPIKTDDAAGDFVVVTSGSTTNLDTVSGFEPTEDKIDLNALNLTGIDDGTSVSNAYTKVSDGDVDVAFATDGSNTYVYVDLGTTIGAIEVTGETLVAGDFDL